MEKVSRFDKFPQMRGHLPFREGNRVKGRGKVNDY